MNAPPHELTWTCPNCSTCINGSLSCAACAFDLEASYVVQHRDLFGITVRSLRRLTTIAVGIPVFVFIPVTAYLFISQSDTIPTWFFVGQFLLGLYLYEPVLEHIWDRLAIRTLVRINGLPPTIAEKIVDLKPL